MNCFGSRKKNSYNVSDDAANTEGSNQKNGKAKEKKNSDDDNKVEQAIGEEETECVKDTKENNWTEGNSDQNIDDENTKINTAAVADKDKKEEKKLKKKEELDSKKEKKEKEKREKKEKKEKEKEEKKKGSAENLDDKKKEKKDKKTKKDKKSEKDAKGEVNGAGPDVGLAAAEPEDDCRSFPEVGLVPLDAAEAALVPGDDVETADKSDAGDPERFHQTGDLSISTEAPEESETDAKVSVNHQHPSHHAESCQPDDDADDDDVRDDDLGVSVKDDVIRDDDAVNQQPDDDGHEVESTERNGDEDSTGNSLNEGCYDHDEETEGQGHEGQGHEGQGHEGQGHEGQGHEGQGHEGQQRRTELVQ